MKKMKRMNKSQLIVALCLAFAPLSTFAIGDSSSAAGGAGGTGGNATGGSATGGAGGQSTATNSVGDTTASGGGGGTATSGGGVATSSTGPATASTGNTDVKAVTDIKIEFQASDKLGITTDNTSTSTVNGTVTNKIENSGTVVNEVKYSGEYKLKNTPDMNVGGPASGPCNGFSATVGLSVPGLGIGGGVSKVDDGCTRRETARIAAMIGRMDIANAVLEADPIVEAAMKVKADKQAAAREAVISREAEAKQMKEQQTVAAGVFERKKIMNSTDDTFHFTGEVTQADEKTEQQKMADKAAASAAVNEQYTDPIVRSRLGLPPL